MPGNFLSGPKKAYHFSDLFSLYNWGDTAPPSPSQTHLPTVTSYAKTTFFAFLHFFSLFFAFFRFKFFASLRFSNFRFEAKRGGKLFRFKRSKILYLLHYFASQFRFGWKKTFLSIFLLNFRFASIFFNFRLFYLRFRFRFLEFRIEVNHVKSGIFFASKRNEIFALISNFASEAKVRAHPSLQSWAGIFKQSMGPGTK